MVIESLDIDPLLGIGLISFSKSQSYKNIFFRIGALYMVMVPESFAYRPSPRDWSNLVFFKKKNKKN